MEIRFPFLDLRVVEFFLSVPAAVRMGGGYLKNFVQSALADVMPMPVRTVEHPAYFVPRLSPSERINLEMGRLRHYLLQSEAPVYEYVRRESVEKMILAAASGQKVNIPFLWRIARLNAWLQTSLSQDPLHEILVSNS